MQLYYSKPVLEAGRKSMRCTYISDLHLEFKTLRDPLPEGDILILAGDITLAKCLDPKPTESKEIKLRDSTLAFFDEAREKFDHVLYISGNHEPYHFDIEETPKAIRKYIEGIIYLDDDLAEIDGVTFIGATLWTDMDNENKRAILEISERINDFKIVSRGRAKFTPMDAVAKFRKSSTYIADAVCKLEGKPVVVVTHHAPSPLGLNEKECGNLLDGAFASDLHDLMEQNPNITNWVFGHTHVRKTFQVGDTSCRANCRGYDTVSWSNTNEANGFDADIWFEI